MRNKQWLEILSTTNTDKDLNKNNVIEKIKEKLKATDPDTYKKWEETGFNVNYVGNSAGYTLLHLAVKGGHIEIAQALIDRNANVDVLDRKGLAPLHFAAEKGYTKIVDALMNKEADVNVVNKNKSTPLHLAAKGGHTEIAQALIDRSANVNVLDKCRLTPLHFAAVEGHTKIAKALMDKGADPLLEARDVRVLKRLVTLIKNDSLKHPGKAEKKLQNREQINDKYELLKYSLLLRYNCTLVDVVEFDHLICTWSAEVFDFTQEQEKLNENLLSILKDLSSFEDAYIIQLEKFLRDNESNDDLKTILNLGRGESELTILHVVSSMDKRWKRCVDLLLSAGANPNEKDNRGRTPLHYATEHDIIISLLGKGADSNILDKQEKTPLEVAIDNHNYHVKSSFLTKKQQSLKKEISGTLIPHLIRGKEPSCLTELKKFLNDNKDNEDLKTVLNLRVREGKSEVLQHVRSALYGKTFCKEVESLLLEAGAVDYEGLDGKEHLPKFETLWDSLISSQQQKLKIFLDRVGEAQDMNKLEQVVKDAIEYGVRFNFPYQKSLYEKAYESKYSFMDYVMKRIKEISELKRNSKVASDIVCKLVSRGAVLYTVDSIFVIDTLESEFKDHKTNMLKAHEDYVNRTLKFVGIAKSAATGEIKDAKLDNSTFYLEYSEDSRIDVAKITEGARSLGLTQGSIEYGRDIIKIGESEVEIITNNDIRHYTDLADGSNIVLTFYTSLGELEVNLYPDKQDKIIVEVSNKKEILEKFKNCKEELGKNCSLGGYLVYNAIERGYFERSGKLCQPSETMSSLVQQSHGYELQPIKQQLRQDLRNVESNVIKKEKDFDTKTHLIDIFNILHKLLGDKENVSKTDLANVAEKESKRLGLEGRYNWNELFGLEKAVSQNIEQEGSSLPLSSDLYRQDKLASSVNNKVEKCTTKGDGNCFFHAVFGDSSSGVYKTDRAKEMRQEWHKFLSQFESLDDPKMPKALRERLSLVFHNVFQIQESGFCTSNLYKEYLSKVNEQSYFIYLEEVPILASLANIEVEIRYTQKLPDKIKPDPSMINANYKRNQELWGSKEKETIYLESNHYSRAKVMAQSQKQMQEQRNVPCSNLLSCSAEEAKFNQQQSPQQALTV